MTIFPRAAPWPVMVLAHNEQEHIAACLDSLFAGELIAQLSVYVIANGCTDGTEDVVRRYAEKRPEVELVSLKLGDKCNAWNVFVHDVVPERAPGRDVYFFVNGDARIVPGSLSALANGLATHARAHAAAAPPASGRSMKRNRQLLIEERHLVGNLYALRGTFIEELRVKSVRIPLGLEGDDGLLGALVKWNLDPERSSFDSERIVPCPDAGFVFDSMSMFSLADIRSYWRRAVRYGRRRYEYQLLGKHLSEKGIRGLPSHINELYPESANLRLTWSGLYTIPNWIALRGMRKHARQSRVESVAVPREP